MVEPGGPAGSSRSIVPSSAATSAAYAVEQLRHGRPAELPLPFTMYDRLAVQRNRANGNMVDLPVVDLT